MIIHIAKREIDVVVDIHTEAAQGELVARIAKFHSHRHIVAHEVAHTRAKREHTSLEVEILKKRQHLHIFCVKFAIRRRESESPFTLGNEKEIEKSAIVATEVTLGNNELHCVVAHNHTLLQEQRVGILVHLFSHLANRDGLRYVFRSCHTVEIQPQRVGTANGLRSRLSLATGCIGKLLGTACRLKCYLSVGIGNAGLLGGSISLLLRCFVGSGEAQWQHHSRHKQQFQDVSFYRSHRHSSQIKSHTK